MLIGELVQRSGLSKDTIRFYEKKGLIQVENSRRRNNYKEYSEALLGKLLEITRLKAMGLTLREIESFLSAWRDDDASCATLKHNFENKLQWVDEQMKKLMEIRENIVLSLNGCNSGHCTFDETTSRLS